MNIIMETLYLAETGAVVNRHSGLWQLAAGRLSKAMTSQVMAICYAYSHGCSGFQGHSQTVNINPEDTSKGVGDHI